jgi:archaeal type IV pilus assembly protein PilA
MGSCFPHVTANQWRKKIKMKSLRTIKKNAKAMSPVVASIILIAVTVAVSVAVAAWMGGMVGGLMGGTEKVGVTNMQFDALANPVTITATVQNTGDGSVELKSAFIDGKTATIGDAVVNGTIVNAGDKIILAKGDSATLPLYYNNFALTDGQLYTIKIATAKGNTITYTATYNAAP